MADEDDYVRQLVCLPCNDGDCEACYGWECECPCQGDAAAGLIKSYTDQRSNQGGT